MTTYSHSYRLVPENWKRRTKIVDYCANVVDQSMEDKRAMIEGEANPKVQRRMQAELYEEEVKVR